MGRRKAVKASKALVQNAAKTLLANIRFASIDEPAVTVTVTSSSPGEGKSTIAVKLAQAAATSGRRTLLVECDMRHRTLAGLLGTHGKHGLFGVVSGRCPIEDAVVATPQKRLDFLDAEPGIGSPADVIASRRFRMLVDKLGERYDFVVFDTPPVGAFVDAAQLAAMTDGTVFVVREGFTHRDVAKDALEQLRKAKAKMLGCVLNCCENVVDEGYHNYYYDEGDSRTAAASVEEQVDAANRLNSHMRQA